MGIVRGTGGVRGWDGCRARRKSESPHRLLELGAQLPVKTLKGQSTEDGQFGYRSRLQLMGTACKHSEMLDGRCECIPLPSGATGRPSCHFGSVCPRQGFLLLNTKVLWYRGWNGLSHRARAGQHQAWPGYLVSLMMSAGRLGPAWTGQPACPSTACEAYLVFPPTP